MDRSEKTMNCPILLKLNAYYKPINTKFHESRNGQHCNYSLCHESKLKDLQDGQHISDDKMRELFLEPYPLKHKQYEVYHQDSYYVFIPLTLSTRIRLWLRLHESILLFSRHAVARFRMIKKDDFLRDLLVEKSDLKSSLETLTKFAVCDEYFLWIYNPVTYHLSLLCSSVDYKKDFISPEDQPSILYKFVKGKESFAHGPAYDEILKKMGMKSLNRIRLELSVIRKETVGVVGLYSKYEHFELVDTTRSYIKNFLETKYRAVRAEDQQAINNIERYFVDNFEVGNIKSFLYGLTTKVCEILHFESCAIFAKDPDKNQLTIKALCGKTHPNGRPTKLEKYDLDGTSLTAKAYHTGMPQFSYDLSADHMSGRAKGAFDDDTEHPRNSWIAQPIPTKSPERFWGVLCVSNKYEENGRKERNIVHFRPLDNFCLEMICNSLAHILRIEEEFQETHKSLTVAQQTQKEALNNRMEVVNKLAELQIKLEELSEFNKFFLHEARTPISTFNMAPMIIKNLLHSGKLDSEKIEDVVKKLDDIQLTGRRLEYIINRFNFEELIKYKKDSRLSVLEDIVFPVYNITKVFLETQYGLELKLEPDGLANYFVYGDQLLLNMVLNALVDNAGKYSVDISRPITIVGNTDDKAEYLYITVSSYSLPIVQADIERVFQKGTRGQMTETLKIMGTGTGLYIARRVMKEHNGDLLLQSLKDPVIFSMKIPLKPEKEMEEKWPK